MFKFYRKYNSKIILCVLSCITIASCAHKHSYKNGRIELSDKKMSDILVDILLMESYINEKMQGTSVDSLTVIKKSFYPAILKKHHTDSISFYSTFNYYQTHPKEFSLILNRVDSSLNKIVPKDTSIVVQQVTPPSNLEQLSSFKEQEKAMQEAFKKSKLNEKE